MKKIGSIILAFMVISQLTACSNTVNGAGRDMENMGQWIQERT